MMEDRERDAQLTQSRQVDRGPKILMAVGYLANSALVFLDS